MSIIAGQEVLTVPIVRDNTERALIEVGSVVAWDQDFVLTTPGYERATVVGISDWDGDWNDDLCRAVCITPTLTLQYEDGTTEDYRTGELTGMRYPFDTPEAWAEELVLVAEPMPKGGRPALGSATRVTA
jgi:hypothetical protein